MCSRRTWTRATASLALLAAPDPTHWTGRRDHALLLVLTLTGLRVSELTGLTIQDVHLSAGAHVYCRGKGRKDRATPLTSQTVAVLRSWLTERGGHGADPLFPTRRGGPLSPKAIAWLLDKHTTMGASDCPSLRTKRVTPHVLRHTNAMLIRARDNDILTIALFLCHETTKSTEIYLHADNRLKQQAIERTAPIGTPPGRYKPPDNLLAFLEGL